MPTRFISFLLLILVQISFSIQAQTITTVAGNGTWGYFGNGGPATSAQLADVTGVAADKQGNIYIADLYNNVIRKVNSAGIVSNYAGNGTLGYAGDGGAATSAKLYHPASLSIDEAGNLFFTDQNADVIRKVSPSGIITSITGNLPIGYSGDGGPVQLAQFRSISGVTPDNAGNLYIADASNHVIRKVNTSGIIATIAGNGTSGFSGDGGAATAAQLNSPYNVVLDKAGNIYIPDLVNNRIRKVNSAGIISTFAGNGIRGYSGDGGPAAAASFNLPSYMTIDTHDNIYVADYINLVVRKISAGGIITTFAGSGRSGYTGDGGPAVSATMSDICQIATDNLDNLYIVNRWPFYVVRKVTNCTMPAVTAAPANVWLCTKGDAVFNVTASDATSYKWQIKQGTDWKELTDDEVYFGTASSSIKITGATTVLHSNQYRCVVSNSCGSGNSLPATLSVTPPLDPFVSIQTASKTVCQGKEVQFSASPQMGGDAPVFKWFKNGIATGANNAVYVDKALENGDVIRCTLTSNSNCVTKNTAESNAITMIVNPASFCSESNGSTCGDSLFIKTFSNKDSSLLVQDLITTKNGEVLACGTVRSSSGTSEDGFIIKWNKNGEIIWQNTYSANGSQSILKALQMQDGNFVAVGYDGRENSAVYFLLKFDNNGNVISKSDFFPSFKGGSSIASLLETENKELVMTGYFLEDNLSFNDRGFFLKFGPAGNLLLAKKFTPAGSTNVFIPQSSVIIDGYSYICGYHFAPIAKGLLIKVNNANGNVVWTKVYDYNGTEAVFSQIFKYPENKLCIVGSKSYNESDTSLVFITDTAGTVALSRSIQYNSTRGYGKAIIDKGGNIIWGSYFRKTPGADFTMLAVNPYSGVKWSKNYTQLADYPFIKGIAISSDSSLFATGYKNIGSNLQTFLARFSNQGSVGCQPIDLQVGFISGTSSTGIVPLISTDISLSYKGYTFDILHDVIQRGDDICKYQVNCNSLELTGPDTICRITDTLKLRIKKNKDCVLIPELVYDPEFATLQTRTDSSAIFTIHAPGVVKITARLMNRCDMLVDSVEVIVLNNPSRVYIGADTVLCSNTNLVLRAGPNFKSYRWQDGSTDSIFTVDKPGLYFVNVTDSCNTVLKDSINVLADAPISFDIGKDTSVCSNDNIRITAPSGFTGYTWRPVSNITSTTTQAVTVYPAISTRYFVEAKKTNGCTVVDSILVTVNQPTPVVLARDSSICNKDSITLKAGNNFIKYMWSTGEITPSITVKSAGRYIVSAIDNNNCVSKDTFTLTVYQLPAFSLGDDTAICKNTGYILRPGKFASYRWHDNSTNSTFTASNIGRYWVQITDVNSCKYSDTLQITGIKALPVDFMPDSLKMCEGEEINLAPSASYRRYLWSSGSNQPSVKVKSPGIYWLKVTNNEGCTNTDSTIVSYKDCYKTVYFPTAFTPNADGKNDLFRPVAYGPLQNFHLIIFNRFGQMVFETVDPYKGWDGKVTGTPQDTAAFAWYCTYHFLGGTETSQTQKGTVVLLR